jgi:two-component system, OmpR family, sensor kinase
VILVGWSINQFWEKIDVAKDAPVEIQIIFNLIESQATTTTIEEWQQTGNLSIDVLALEDLADSSALLELKEGNILAVESDKHRYWYKQIKNTNQVLLLKTPIQNDRETLIYRFLLLVFYLAIALVIYLWVWPLSRDAKKLEEQTRQLGKDGVPDTLTISPRSTLYALANAFNLMAQRLREHIRSHSEMTNAVSHELRTPLARMKFAMAMIDQSKLDDKSRNQLQSLSLDISEMDSLISSLLAYAGFEQKTQDLKQTSGYMRDLLEDIVLRFTRGKNSAIKLNIIDTTQNAQFVCEWKLIETVLQNAINNAAKYARGEIRIELIQNTQEYMIAIEDDGCGIAEDNRDKLFNPFIRLYDAGPAKGFGLGLAIIKRIMEWHKGTVAFVDPRALGGARLEVRWLK